MDNSYDDVLRPSMIDTIDIASSLDQEVIALPRVTLEVTTGLLDDGKLSRKDLARVELPEPGNVLKILFSFILPKGDASLINAKHKNGVRDVDLDTLLQVAKAAHTYQVGHVIVISELELHRRVSLSCLEKFQLLHVFTYAVKYRYYDLMDTIAPLLLGTPLTNLVEALASDIYSWIHYIDALEPQRIKWLNALLWAFGRSLNRDNDRRYNDRYGGIEVAKDLHSTLIVSMIPLNELLKKISSLRDGDVPEIQSHSVIETYQNFPRFSTFLQDERDQNSSSSEDGEGSNEEGSEQDDKTDEEIQEVACNRKSESKRDQEELIWRQEAPLKWDKEEESDWSRPTCAGWDDGVDSD